MGSSFTSLGAGTGAGAGKGGGSSSSSNGMRLGLAAGGAGAGAGGGKGKGKSKGKGKDVEGVKGNVFKLCCNSNLRRGMSKGTEMGLSMIHGLGLFMTDPKGAKKGEWQWR